MSFLYFFDLLGTFAFAISGALLGVKKDMDVYGQFVLALAVAVGGGTVRDMMLGNVPPFVLKDVNYLGVTLLAVVLVAISHRKVARLNSTIIFMDAIGLGVFTVIGATKALNADLSWYAVVFCAVLTSTGGGMIRDVLAQEIPFVLRREVYASASMLGGLIFFGMYQAGIPNNVSAFVTSFIVIALRLLTLRKNYHLPKKLGRTA